MKRLKKYGVFVILTLILGGFIAFVEKQSIYKTYQGTEIEIEGVSGLYFVDKQEIETLLAEAFPNLKVGLLLEEVPLNAIEDRLQGHPFIKMAEREYRAERNPSTLPRAASAYCEDCAPACCQWIHHHGG